MANLYSINASSASSNASQPKSCHCCNSIPSILYYHPNSTFLCSSCLDTVNHDVINSKSCSSNEMQLGEGATDHTGQTSFTLQKSLVIMVHQNVQHNPAAKKFCNGCGSKKSVAWYRDKNQADGHICRACYNGRRKKKSYVLQDVYDANIDDLSK